MPTVLIADPAHLGVLKDRDQFRDALAFADTDALRAFAAIARQRADVVIVDSAFAATSRGTALINRIKADPLLRDCDVRVLSSEELEPSDMDIPRPVVMEAADVPGPASAAASVPAAAPDAASVEIRDGLEVVVEGTTAALLKLSTVGAEVLSPSSLKPHQRVRLTLPGAPPVHVNGEITWAMFEMPVQGPRYRADIAFLNPDAARIAAFIAANRRS